MQIDPSMVEEILRERQPNQEDSGPEGNRADSGKAITITQEDLDKMIASRLERGKQSWSKSERDKIRQEMEEEIRGQVAADLNRKTEEERGEWQKLYQAILSGDTNLIPKDSKLFEQLESSQKSVRKYEKLLAEELDRELEEMPEEFRDLIPDIFTVAEKLAWLRKAKKNLPAKTQARGIDPNDPKPDRAGFDMGETLTSMRKQVGYQKM